MMEPVTSPTLHSVLPDIAEEPEDTPKSVEREQRVPPRGALALALAPIMMTPLLAFSDPLVVPIDRTALVEEERIEESPLLPSATMPLPEHLSQESAAHTANRTRLELLARQYVAGTLSTEEEARLAIVSECVRRLIPRVAVEDFEMLEHILEEVQHIELADIARRHRLGID